MRFEVRIGVMSCRGDDSSLQAIDFAACALHRTFSATWVCRPERHIMNSCMLVHATQHEQDAAREEWFATRGQRMQEREAKERKKAEQEKFHREWWGLPPKEAEQEEANTD